MRFTINEQKDLLKVYMSYDIPFEGLKASNLNISYEDKNKKDILKLIIKFIEEYEQIISR